MLFRSEEGQRIEFELTQMRDGRLTALGLRLLEEEDIVDPDTDEPPGTNP